MTERRLEARRGTGRVRPDTRDTSPYLVLTFLGLTLAATTSTELQIATNYRWGQQATYNAEAGIEVAKIYLRAVPNDWATILPKARTGITSGLRTQGRPVGSPCYPLAMWRLRDALTGRTAAATTTADTPATASC